MKKGYLYTGVFLFIAYILQDVLVLHWQYLADLQLQESYKRWSGLALFTYIGLQWSLTLFRIKKSLEDRSATVMSIHKWMGAFSPLIFYVHSMKFGFAYLFILSVLFFVNVFLGFVHMDELKAKAYWYFQGWMIAHVAFSLAVSLLAFYHIWIVFYYS